VSARRTVLVLHLAGQYPMAGVGWQAAHYLLGLQRLGYDVYYVEDSGANHYDPRANSIVDDCSYSVAFLARLMARIGMADRWVYWDWGHHACYGLSRLRLEELYRSADALLNVCGPTLLRAEHMRVPVRIYVETDPVALEIKLAQGDRSALAFLEAHTHHATYGENLGEPDCPIPLEKFAWTRTRPPVVLDLWAADYRPEAPHFTTIGTWDNDARGIDYQGERYFWSKRLNFLRFSDLPRRTAQTFELALGTTPAEDQRRLREHGWRLTDPRPASGDLDSYRAYIAGSRGEFTVAKDLVVRTRSGWFSDRSACYLAAGKPVVTQATGFEKHIPTGLGLFAFSTVDEARAAVEAVNADYERHCRAAGAIAAECFSSDRVLGALMRAVGV
jgi:hypothetical protein